MVLVGLLIPANYVYHNALMPSLRAISSTYHISVTKDFSFPLAPCFVYAYTLPPHPTFNHVRIFLFRLIGVLKCTLTPFVTVLHRTCNTDRTDFFRSVEHLIIFIVPILMHSRYGIG